MASYCQLHKSVLGLSYNHSIILQLYRAEVKHRKSKTKTKMVCDLDRHPSSAHYIETVEV